MNDNFHFFTTKIASKLPVEFANESATFHDSFKSYANMRSGNDERIINMLSKIS